MDLHYEQVIIFYNFLKVSLRCPPHLAHETARVRWTHPTPFPLNIFFLVGGGRVSHWAFLFSLPVSHPTDLFFDGETLSMVDQGRFGRGLAWQPTPFAQPGAFVSRWRPNPPGAKGPVVRLRGSRPQPRGRDAVATSSNSLPLPQAVPQALPQTLPQAVPQAVPPAVPQALPQTLPQAVPQADAVCGASNSPVHL